MTLPSSIAVAHEAFDAPPGYLDTASVGLPPRPVVDALHAAVRTWQRGEAVPLDYDADVRRSRECFARLVGVPPGWVATGSQVSGFVGMVAASLPARAVVLVAEGEFTSVLFPFLAQKGWGGEVRTVKLADLPGAIDASVDVIAVSAVQSADGRVADLDGIGEAAERQGALTLIDTTQAVGWLPFDAAAFDLTVSGAHKWQLSPRGSAFLTVRPDVRDRIVPVHAGWYAGEDPWESIYGQPLRLASDARRFDLSPAWLSWAGTRVALEFLESVGVEAIHHHAGLANQLRERIGLPPSDSAVVSLDIRGNADGLADRGLRVSRRAGGVRASFHLHNTAADVEMLTEVLAS